MKLCAIIKIYCIGKEGYILFSTRTSKRCGSRFEPTMRRAVMGKLLSCFDIQRFYRKEARAVGILVCAGLLLAIVTASAFAADPQQPMKAPPGTYWDEELGVFVLDPPIPIRLPATLAMPNPADMLYFDGDTVYYYAPQQYNYFALTRMTRPDCESGRWMLTSVLLGCWDDGTGPPQQGRLAIYDHAYDVFCEGVTDSGHMLGTELGSTLFTGLPYDPDTTPNVIWTTVDFMSSVPIVDEDFWVVWDYMTPELVPQFASYYGVGNWRKDPPLDPWDYRRFFEGSSSPCPTYLTIYGPWLIRAIGHCYGGEGMIDIKPQSCPNPLNVKSKGVLPIAILGSDEVDVRDIDPATILMEGVPPLRWAYEDVAEPFPGELCDCWTEGPDGWEDLTVKFEKQAIVAALGDVNDRDTLRVTVTWDLYDGLSMEGSDCVIILKKPAPKPHFMDIQMGGVRSASAQNFALFQNTPNPVRSRTTIMFSLPENAYTTLTVRDASGSTVATLVEGDRTAGIYTAEWMADVPAGVYFYSLESGGLAATKKLIRVR
jgi:hypothetical protein